MVEVAFFDQCSRSICNSSGGCSCRSVVVAVRSYISICSLCTAVVVVVVEVVTVAYAVTVVVTAVLNGLSPGISNACLL